MLGASGFTFAEATWTQTLANWIGAHVRMFRFFDGVPRPIMPDNLKSSAVKAGFNDPDIKRNDGMMAAHYGVGILPARPRWPKGKAKVENGVRFAQTCILGRLRHQTFFSLAEANAAIRGALDCINDHPIRRLATIRRRLFETIERPALAPLPGADYEFAEWRLARVSLDYLALDRLSRRRRRDLRPRLRLGRHTGSASIGQEIARQSATEDADAEQRAAEELLR